VFQRRRRVEGRDERRALRLIRALGENLLKLIHHYQQPRTRWHVLPRRCARRPGGRRCRRQGGLPHGKRESRRVRLCCLPQHARTGTAKYGDAQCQLIERGRGGGEHQARPGRRFGCGGQPGPPDPGNDPGAQQ
jgi:hypothetical protein